MKNKEIPAFNRLVIPWYNAQGRDLPWRQTRDPYAIWLSEIILQQTRVQQGMAYYHAFLEKFPKVQDLARASEDDVFRIWQGLGYYSRARNLHKAAKMIVDQWNGVFPNDFSSWLQVPGVGPYTAAAISSFAYDFPKAAIDGNVLRWLSRYLGSRAPIDAVKTRNDFQVILDEWIQSASPHTFNQASMEFGAMLCTPKNPQCNTCPLSQNCVAFAQGSVAEIPIKANKTKVKSQSVFALFIENNAQEWAVIRRNETGIWSGLYTLPLIIQDHHDPEQGWLELLQKFELDPTRLAFQEEWKATHMLTHRKLQVHIFSILMEDMELNTHKFEKWINANEAENLGFPKIFVDFLKHKGRL